MYRPFDIGRKFRIVPPATPPGNDHRIDLITERGAFGSGEHETTASCLEILEALPGLTGAKVLDFGCGTGILAIAALKLGAGSAVCLDISPDAVRTCIANCETNGVSANTRWITGSLNTLQEVGFDLILANIYADILLDSADELFGRLKPGGRMLLSGILWEFNFEVRQRYEKAGCTLLKNHMLEEFSTLLLQRA